MSEDRYLKQYWDDQRGRVSSAIAQGKVLIHRNHSRIQVAAPYNEVFRAGAMRLSAKWKPRSKQWSFPEASAPLLLDLIVACYGDDKVPKWLRQLAA